MSENKKNDEIIYNYYIIKYVNFNYYVIKYVNYKYCRLSSRFLRCGICSLCSENLYSFNIKSIAIDSYIHDTSTLQEISKRYDILLVIFVVSTNDFVKNS